MAVKKSPTPSSKKKKKNFFFVFFSVLFVFLSNSALWFNRYIFNTQNFTSTATNALLQESSRVALATEVTDRMFEGRPIIKNILDDKVIKVTSALLDTSQARTAVEKTVLYLQTSVTSKDPKPIAFDLTGIKSTITKVSTVIDDRTNKPESEKKLDPNDIPDQLVLFDPSTLPNFYVYGTIIMWLGPIAFAGGIGLLAVMVYKNRNDKTKRYVSVYLASTALILSGVIAHITGPLFRPPVLSVVQSPNTRVVVGNIYDAFMGQFASQTNAYIGLGLIMAVIATALMLDAKGIIKGLKLPTKNTKKVKS